MVDDPWGALNARMARELERMLAESSLDLQRSAVLALQGLESQVLLDLNRAANTLVHAASSAIDFERLANILEEIEPLKFDRTQQAPAAAELAQTEARIREETPFSDLTRMLPENKEQWYAFIAILIMVLFGMIEVAQRQEIKTITPDQVEQIIENVVEHIEQELPAPPPKKQPEDNNRPPMGSQLDK